MQREYFYMIHAGFTLNSNKIKKKEDNFAFYSSKKGKEILNNNNFPSDIKLFLENEYITIQNILVQKKRSYDALLEVGCGNARNIDLALTSNLRYFGIDFIEQEVELATKKIKEKNVDGKAKCVSIMHLNYLTTPVPSSMRTICLFPFNLFGNIFDAKKAIQIMHDLNYDFLVSTYRDDILTSSITDYYRACGLNDIKKTSVKNGVLYSSVEGFNSIIYKSDYLQNIAIKFDFSITTMEFCKIGKLYYIHRHS